MYLLLLPSSFLKLKDKEVLLDALRLCQSFRIFTFEIQTLFKNPKHKVLSCLIYSLLNRFLKDTPTK
jgi:hypothetical protein